MGDARKKPYGTALVLSVASLVGGQPILGQLRSQVDQQHAPGTGVETLEESRPAGLGPTLEMSGAPIIGGPFGLRVRAAIANAPGVLFVSAENATSRSPRVGAGLLTAGSAMSRVHFQTTNTGEAPLLIRVDSVPPALSGLSFVARGLVLDPLAPGGASLTQGVQVTFGPKPPGYLYPARVLGPTAGIPTDLNDDPWLDVVATAPFQDELITVLGQADGVQGAVNRYSVGDFPNSVTTGDLDGDGRRDVITLNTGSNDVSVLLGSGGGSLSPARGFFVCDFPIDSVIEDFDNDGNADVAALCGIAGEVRILLGNGDGTLAPAQGFPTLPNPAALVAADFDGDGIVDLATGSAGLSVLIGLGDGSFAAPLVVPTASSTETLDVGDFDGDGVPDLAQGTRYETVDIYLGNGAGDFSAAGVALLDDRPDDVFATDVDSDGSLDLIVTDGSTWVFLGQGDGSFVQASKFPVSDISMTLRDLDRDGIKDLVYSGSSVVRGLGNGAFDTPLHQVIPSSGRSLAVGDLDGDQILDIVATSASSPSASILRGLGHGQFAPPVSLPGSVNGFFVHLADLNGDGLLDFVSDSGLEVVVLLGAPGGSFGPPSSFPAPGVTSLTLRDFNGDGFLDAAGVHRLDGIVSLIPGFGDGTFGSPQVLYVGEDPEAIAAGDFDENGVLDLAVAHRQHTAGSNDVAVLLGQGDGSFLVHSRSFAGDDPAGIATGDLNGDGILDLAVTNDAPETVTTLLGAGDGTFALFASQASERGASSVAIDDVNGDRRPDVVVVGRGTSVYLGRRNGTLGRQRRFTGIGGSTSDIALRDLNGDLLPDIVSVGSHTLVVVQLNGLLRR